MEYNHRVQHAEQIAAIGLPFAWCGLVFGISFIETPLKFTAPGITTALGLSIGRIVFRALNSAELVITCVLAVVLARQADGWPLVLLAGLVALLLAQTFWLRPRLDHRALRVIAGDDLAPSSLHVVYIALEIVKLLALPVLGAALAARWLA
jgi:uncharacterized membrane protein HdeD (DUF308 family)